MRIGECVATSYSALLQQIQWHNFTPKKCLIFGVLEHKTSKNGGEAVRKKVGRWLGAAFICLGLTEGRQHNRNRLG